MSLPALAVLVLPMQDRRSCLASLSLSRNGFGGVGKKVYSVQRAAVVVPLHKEEEEEEEEAGEAYGDGGMGAANGG